MIGKLLNSKASTAILVLVILAGIFFNSIPYLFYTIIILLASLLAVELIYDIYIYIKRQSEK